MAGSRGTPAFRAIAAKLEQRILSGELPVGSALPGELLLASAFEVSRSTIREAIRLLEQMGLLARQQGRNKLLITAPRAEDIAARMKAAFVLRATTFNQLWEVLAAIEPMCAEAAAREADEAVLALIEDNLERTRHALAQGQDLVWLDIEFHALVAQASGNTALQICRETVGELFYPAFSQVMSHLNAGQRLYVSHENIFAALKARNGPVAREWMERHIGDFKRGWELAGRDLKALVTDQVAAEA